MCTPSMSTPVTSQAMCRILPGSCSIHPSGQVPEFLQLQRPDPGLAKGAPQHIGHNVLPPWEMRGRPGQGQLFRSGFATVHSVFPRFSTHGGCKREPLRGRRGVCRVLDEVLSSSRRAIIGKGMHQKDVGPILNESVGISVHITVGFFQVHWKLQKQVLVGCCGFNCHRWRGAKST